MQTVSIIGFNGTLASAITGIIDLFRLAGVTWARINDEEPMPRFTTRLLTFDGQPFRCINGITLLPDGSLTDPATEPAQNSLVMIPPSARQFLEQSRLSVDDITRRIGYEDVSSFSRLFRKHTGLAPGAYRSRFGL